jgi:hypothetical protein
MTLTPDIFDLSYYCFMLKLEDPSSASADLRWRPLMMMMSDDGGQLNDDDGLRCGTTDEPTNMDATDRFNNGADDDEDGR